MVFFVIIVINNFAGVAAVTTVFLLLTLVGIDGIDPSGRCSAFLGMKIFFILAIIFLLVFPSLFEGAGAFDF